MARLVAAATVDDGPVAREADPDQGRSWVRRLLPFLTAHRGPLVTSLVAALAGQAFQVATPRVLMSAIDDALVQQTAPLPGYVMAVVALGLGRLAVGALHRHRAFVVGANLEADLRVTVQQHLGRLGPRFFDGTQTGQLMSRANSDIRSVQMFLVFAPVLAITFVGFAGALAIMLTIHVWLTCAALVALPLVFLSGLRMRRRLFPVAWLVQARTASVATIVEENLAGAHVVRGLAAEGDQVTRLDRAAERLRWISEREIDLRARYQPLLEGLPRIGVAAVFTYGGWLAIDGSITIGALVAFNTYLALLLFPFSFLGQMVMLAQRAAASADRVLEILDHRPDVSAPSHPVAPVRADGAIEFRQVRFAYDGGQWVLDGFDLHIAPGETVALVGGTGSGKSTVGHLLLRHYDVQDGRILLDGHDLREIAPERVRQQIGMVAEDPFLFSASVHENIAYGRPDATREQVEAAARMAAADGFVSELPDGYDTNVGERGFRLSGGQRQRLAIARALLYDPTVLVLDDATSAVDAETEQQILRALRDELNGRTLLLCAHRLSTILLADRVAVLAHGRIVASGTHEQLLESSPEYTALLEGEADDREPALLCGDAPAPIGGSS